MKTAPGSRCAGVLGLEPRLTEPESGGLEAAIAAHAVNNVFAFGYAVLRGGLVETRAIQASDWATTGWNLLAYGLVGLACWSIGRRMRVASRTPGLAS